MTPCIVYAIWDFGSILCTERLTALAPQLGYNLRPHCPTAPLVSGPPSLPLLLPTTTPPTLFPAASFTIECPGRLVRARGPSQLPSFRTAVGKVLAACAAREPLCPLHTSTKTHGHKMARYDTSTTYVHTYDTIRDDTYDTTVIIYGTHTHIQSVVRYEFRTYDTTVEIYDTGVMIGPIRHYILQYEESAVGRMADLCSSYTCLHLAFDSVHIRQDSMQPLWANAF